MDNLQLQVEISQLKEQHYKELDADRKVIIQGREEIEELKKKLLKMNQREEPNTAKEA